MSFNLLIRNNTLQSRFRLITPLFQARDMKGIKFKFSWYVPLQDLVLGRDSLAKWKGMSICWSKIGRPLVLGHIAREQGYWGRWARKNFSRGHCLASSLLVKESPVPWQELILPGSSKRSFRSAKDSLLPHNFGYSSQLSGFIICMSPSHRCFFLYLW